MNKYLNSILILILISTMVYASSGEQGESFTFPLAGKNVYIGESADSIKSKFPNARTVRNKNSGVKHFDIIEAEFGQDTVSFKFSKNRLMAIETYSGTEGLGEVLSNFSEWVRNKYGKGKAKEINKSQLITEWRLPKAIIVEALYGGSESGDVVISYNVYGK